MPFGLTDAPAAFQCFMNNVFSNLLNIYIVVYLDDILIYSNEIIQHRSHIKEILKQLHRLGLYTKAEKCEFHSDSMEYLGYILSPSGLTMSDAKVKTIQEQLEPKKIKNIQSFLGFANFYKCFIFNYLDIVIVRATGAETLQEIPQLIIVYEVCYNLPLGDFSENQMRLLEGIIYIIYITVSLYPCIW